MLRTIIAMLLLVALLCPAAPTRTARAEDEGLTLEAARMLPQTQADALDRLFALALAQPWHASRGLSMETYPLWEEAFSPNEMMLLAQAFYALQVQSIRLVSVQNGSGTCQAVVIRLPVQDVLSCCLVQLDIPLENAHRQVFDPFGQEAEALDDRWILLYDQQSEQKGGAPCRRYASSAAVQASCCPG